MMNHFEALSKARKQLEELHCHIVSIKRRHGRPVIVAEHEKPEMGINITVTDHGQVKELYASRLFGCQIFLTKQGNHYVEVD